MAYKDDIQIYGEDFSYSHHKTNAVISSNFVLHNHNDSFETLIFLNGTADFIVEGSVYTMNKGDIVIAGSNEMHKMLFQNEGEYERIVISTSYKFFFLQPELKSIFTKRKLGNGNQLCLSDTEHTTILDICEKIEYYQKTYPADDVLPNIMRNLITEIMFIINKSNYVKENIKTPDERIKKILIYINDRLSEKLTLDEIADTFYVNKYHLCRIFKKNTGMTLNRYITYKRLIRARELHADGKTLMEAGLEAGFDSYSTFYKVYKREMGYSPSAGG